MNAILYYDYVKLTKEEAKKFIKLYNELNNEMNTRIKDCDYNCSLYTTIMRNKY